MDFRPFKTHVTKEDPRQGRWADLINDRARKFGVPPCAIAAIIARESDWDEKAVSGDGGYGLMQVTYLAYPPGIYQPTYENLLDGAVNMDVAVRDFLAPAVSYWAKARWGEPGLYSEMQKYSPGECVYYVFGEYNAGRSAIVSALVRQENPDSVTTNDYCSGTLALYHAFLEQSA